MESTRYRRRFRWVAASIVLVCLCMWWFHMRTDAQDVPHGVERREHQREIDQSDWPILGDDGNDVTTYETTDELPQTAKDLVCQYRDAMDCIVHSAGYMDVLGNAWSCIVEGPGWVDLCLVTERGGGCTVEVVRMEVTDWRESYAQQEDDVGPVDR